MNELLLQVFISFAFTIITVFFVCKIKDKQTEEFEKFRKELEDEIS